MPFNALNQYVATHKVWDHVGNILPNVEHSEGIRPSVEWRPASWLPVQFRDKHYENWNVIMPGKIVAADNDGDLVPAGLGVTGASIVYTADDVEQGVLDVRTGAALLTAAIGTVAVSAVTAFLGRASTALAVSAPLGVAPYAYLQWAGGDGSNPANYRQHNYNMQHQVAVLCDYVLELPLVPARTATEALTFGAPAANLSDSTAVANRPLATNTTRSPYAFAGGSSATLFVNQVTTRALVRAAGDWFVNLATGVVTVFAGAAPASVTLTYYHYAAAPATLSRFASAVGNLRAGDFVVSDANSNYALAAAGDNLRTIVGQVLARRSYPRDALERVRTAYNPAIGTSGAGGLPGSLGQLDQMPGSATGGVPDNVHYAGAADQTVLINLLSR